MTPRKSWNDGNSAGNVHSDIRECNVPVTLFMACKRKWLTSFITSLAVSALCCLHQAQESSFASPYVSLFASEVCIMVHDYSLGCSSMHELWESHHRLLSLHLLPSSYCGCCRRHGSHCHSDVLGAVRSQLQYITWSLTDKTWLYHEDWGSISCVRWMKSWGI